MLLSQHRQGEEGYTSIETDEQFAIFLLHTRAMLVPQKLANGKISACQIKPFTVIFEDTAQKKRNYKV